MDDWAPQLTEPEESPITEEFDPTWPYNFKWGYDALTNAVHVWRVKGGTDGRPTHRPEFRALFGHDPQVREGDILGLATYVPAEVKLDGTIVAPPQVQVQAYYGQQPPRELYDWFEQNFPGVVVRQAAIVRPRLGQRIAEWEPSKLETVLRWIWNQRDGLLVWASDSNGLPTHNTKARLSWGRPTQAGDFLGYADVEGDTVKIDPIKYATPPVAIAAIKSELAKMYPDKHITSDTDLAEQYGVEFHGTPDKLGRREATIRWAQIALGDPLEMPLGGSESDSQTTHREKRTPGLPSAIGAGLKRLFTVPSIFTGAVNKAQIVKNAEADMDGAMVGIFIPEEIGKKLKIEGGEPLDNLHITLLYFQDKAADRDDWDEIERIVEQVAKQTPAMTGKVSGYGVFTNDGVDVLWASPSLQGLAELRHKLFEACEDAGFPVSTTHDWAPHITLKYDFDGKLPKLDKEIKLDLPELAFAQGNKQNAFKFEGHFEKKADWEADEWKGWNGPHRFVTDGKEVLADATGVDQMHDGRHEDLEDAFRSYYPETEHVVSGWAIPTADQMGYGVYSPTAGYGNEDVPQLQDIQKALDRHFKKPTHFLDDWQLVNNSDMYQGTHDVGLAR